VSGFDLQDLAPELADLFELADRVVLERERVTSSVRYVDDGRARPWLVTVHSRGQRASAGYVHEDKARLVAAMISIFGRCLAPSRLAWPVPADTALRSFLVEQRETLAHSTEETYRASIECHLVPYFGGQDLRTVTPSHVAAFVGGAMARGVSAATCQNAVSVLRRCCGLLVEVGELEKNPAASGGRIVSRVARRHLGGLEVVSSWSRAEAEQLLELARTHEPAIYGPLLAAFSTGMRRGELIELRWDRIDLVSRELHVTRARVRGRETAPKSRRARAVPIAEPLYAYLAERSSSRMAREGLHTEPGYVFLAARGGRWDERNFERTWARLRARAAREGVRPLRFHCTRHTWATLALEAGRGVKWVSQVLGHASPVITLGTYAHALPVEASALEFVPLGSDSARARDAQGAQ
jgi:integrase